MIRAAAIGVLISAFVLGCADEDGTMDASATDSIAVGAGIEGASGDGAQDEVKMRDPFDDFGLRINDVSATDRQTPVWLVNQSAQRLIVTAWGGTENVVVDTVGASDSTFVRINTRALTLELSARTSNGVPMGTVALPMDSRPKRAAFPH